MLEQINTDLFQAINSFAGINKQMDLSAILFAEYMPYVLLVIAGCLFIQNNKSQRIAIIESGVAICVSMLMSYVISLFYYHPRPFMLELGNTLVAHAPDSSFPSDHTTFMFAMSFSLLYSSVVKSLSSISLILACIGGVARIYVGVHFPFDILAAAGVGFIAARAVSLAWGLLNRTGKANALVYDHN